LKWSNEEDRATILVRGGQLPTLNKMIDFGGQDLDDSIIKELDFCEVVDM